MSSAVDQVTNLARQFLRRLHQEVRSKEAELHKLKRQETDLLPLTIGAPGSRGRGLSRTSNSASGSKRVNWSNVLAQLSKQFKASDVRKLRGLKDKRSSEIFAAITRWIEAGTVKRKERGVYAKVAAAKRATG